MPMCVHLASDAEEVATVQANRETNQHIPCHLFTVDECSKSAMILIVPKRMSAVYAFIASYAVRNVASRTLQCLCCHGKPAGKIVLRMIRHCSIRLGYKCDKCVFL